MKALIVGACLLVSSVAWAAPTLTVNGSSAAISVAPGSVVTVGMQNAPGTVADCVGLYPTGGALVSYQYAGGGVSLTFVMPLAGGTYEFRYYQNCAGAQLLATSPTVTVQNTGTPSLTVNGVTSPLTVAAGATVTVGVQNAPGTVADCVGLYPTGGALVSYQYAGGGVSLTFVMPLAGGTYEFRYYQNCAGAQLLATSPTVTVQNTGTPSLTVNGVTSPLTVAAGATVTVGVQNGPGNPLDCVALYPAGLPDVADGSYLNVFFLNGSKTAPTTGLTAATVAFPMPATLGQYEFRLWKNCATILAKSQVVSTGPLSFTGCPGNPSSVTSGNWSNPAVWQGGCLPTPTDHVTIVTGQTVTYDLSAGSVTEVLISGTLAFSQVRNTQLDVGSIIVLAGGALEVGTEAAPIPMGITAVIRLADIAGATYTHIHGQPGLQPVLHAHGGRIDLHGTGPLHPWSRLAMMNSAAGITALTVADDLTGWKAGDRIVITSTRKPEILAGCTATDPFHFGTFDTVLESLTCLDQSTMQEEDNVIQAVSGNTITLAAPLIYPHRGTFPRQAAVGNLTRNVIVTSLTPDARRGHVHMATDVVNSSTGVQPVCRISDAAFIQLGRPEAGSYGGPHFHMQGNAPGNYLKRSVIYDSANVWVRVHQSNFLTIQDNIGYQTRGNGFSTEDASEVFNTFDHNLGVAATKQPAASTNPNDVTDENEGSAFWLNNPRNIVTNNMAADSVYGFRYHAPVNPNKVLALADATGILQAPIDITQVEVLRNYGNTATGNFRAGLEVVGIQSPATSLIQNLTALDNRNTNLNSLSANLIVGGLYADNGGTTPLGDFNHADIGLYIGQLNFTVRDSYLSYYHLGYQMVGYSLVENTTVGGFMRACEGACEVLNVFNGPSVFPYGFHIINVTSPADGATWTGRMLLFNYDGPGQHVSLIPYQTVGADGLTYALSTRFGDTYNGPRVQPSGDIRTWQWSEATFTGPDKVGPPLTLPLHIDAGNKVTSQLLSEGGDLSRVDQIVNGVRWRVDGTYVPSPPGYQIYTYGYDGILPPKINPSDEFTTAVKNDGSVMGSYRSGQEFAYYIGVPPGTYWVDLGFQETFADYPSFWCRAIGCRGIQVTAEGMIIFPSIDPQKEVGLNQPLWKSFAVTVTDGTLTLDFKDTVGGYAMVSAIAVCPQSMVVGGRCP